MQVLPRHILIAGVLSCLAASPAGAQGDLSVQPARVEAGFLFNGTRLEVSGTVRRDSQVAVLLVGPPDELVYNRRGKIAGLIYGGVEHVSFHGAPGIYALYTSAALSSLGGLDLRNQLQLGYQALAERIRVEGSTVDPKAVVGYYLHLKDREGLYRVLPGAVHLDDVQDGRQRFRVPIDLPTNVAPGVLQVSVYEFADGRLVSTARAAVPLERVGLPATLHRFAHAHGVLFGLLAVVVSLATGLGTGLLSRRRTQRRRRPAAEAGDEDTPVERGAEAATVLPAVLRTVKDTFSAHPFGPGRVEGVEDLRARYRIFRDLLRVNNEVLALLAELEEESSWTSFRQPRVRMGIRALFDGTADMVTLLNQLTDDRCFDLVNVVSGIRRDVMDFLARMEQQDEPRRTLQLSEITSDTVRLVGGKAANLARLECDLGVPVPASFVITIDAYREFLENQKLGSELRTVLAPARLDAPADFRRRCELAQGLIDEADVPESVIEAITRAWAACGLGDAEGVAVRSSAAGEDSELSFAGQFDTVLNVPRAGIGDAWKKVVRSRFAPRAVFYRRAAGLAEVDTPMAVLVQRMVASRASGVLFTRRPDDPKSPAALVTAVLGLGPDASVGIAHADEMAVSRKAPHRILERRVARKTDQLVGAGAGVGREPVAPALQAESAITDAEAAALVKQALAVEHYFGRPQDIEWTIDAGGRIFLLQSRPLRTERAEAADKDVPADAPLLVRGGQPVWGGRAVGPVYVARTREDEEQIPEGAVLVVPQLLPDCVAFLPRICGVIVERGGVTGHAASIVREFHVPSLFGVDGALDKLVPGQVVSLDVLSRAVYAGALWPELRGHLPLTIMGRRTLGLPSVLAGKLTKLSGSSFMSSWACQSLHDVIRFAHETAILAMFDMGDRLVETSVRGVKKLDCPPPVYMHVVDLGGGLRPEAARKRTVVLDDVRSVPLIALMRGLTDQSVDQHRQEIPEPHHFASVMVSTVTTDGLRRLGAPNYACVTDQYLNLNSRQAYHYAIVDAFLGENLNNNHISLRMKGGGAAAWQRTLRVEFMAEVLRLHRFTVQVTSDVLNCWCRGIDQTTGSSRLATIGRLLRFSAQLDLWMTDASEVKRNVRTFIEAETALDAAPGRGVAGRTS